ncbi:hypothetical protein [Congregibacter sp.]|uniref:hypothetical protein n=1 Tax=Congregibacter sp. TaxID=2744308 RepID=UPI00385DC4D9
MRVALTLTLSSLFLLPMASYADPCSDVVTDTVAEMRAGADGWWSEDIEGLVRAAAGSACIKAQSTRYQAAGVSTVESVAVDASNVPAPSSSESVAQAEAEAQTETAEVSDGGDEEDGSWSIGGLTIRSMSGSPSQKPYERARQTKKEEEQ